VAGIRWTTTRETVPPFPQADHVAVFLFLQNDRQATRPDMLMTNGEQGSWSRSPGGLRAIIRHLQAQGIVSVRSHVLRTSMTMRLTSAICSTVSTPRRPGDRRSR